MINFLFGFKGRINRTKMWQVYLLSCVALCVPISVSLVIWEEALIGANPRPTMPSPVAIGALSIWSAVVFYVLLAAIVKRFHDRNKSAWWLAYFYGPPVAFAVAAIFWIGWPPQEVFPGARIAMHVFFFIAWLNGIWYMLELLAFRGTNGDNRFGPDPLTKEGGKNNRARRESSPLSF